MVVNLNPGGIAGGSGGAVLRRRLRRHHVHLGRPRQPTPRPPARLWRISRSAHTAPGPPPATRSATGTRQRPAARAGRRLPGRPAGATASTAATPPRHLDLTGVHGHQALPQLPGRRRQPPARRRHRPRPATPPGTVFADFEGTTWGTGWTATGDFADDGPRPGTIGDQQPVSGYQGQQAGQHLHRPRPVHRHHHLTDLHHRQDYINLLVGGGNHPYTGTGIERHRGQPDRRRPGRARPPPDRTTRP